MMFTNENVRVEIGYPVPVLWLTAVKMCIFFGIFNSWAFHDKEIWKICQKSNIIISSQISKNERIPLVGSYGLLLLNCGLILSLIRDYNYKEKEPNFKFPY